MEADIPSRVLMNDSAYALWSLLLGSAGPSANPNLLMAERISGARSEATETIPDLWPQNLRKAASTLFVSVLWPAWCYTYQFAVPIDRDQRACFPSNPNAGSRNDVVTRDPLQRRSGLFDAADVTKISMFMCPAPAECLVKLCLYKQIGLFLDLGRCVKTWLASTGSSVHVSSPSWISPTPSPATATSCDTSGLWDDEASAWGVTTSSWGISLHCPPKVNMAYREQCQ